MDIDEIRRVNLKKLWQEMRSALVEASGMTPAQFYNLRDGAPDSKTGKPRGMRKETARRLEKAAGKPEGYLDVLHQNEAAEIDLENNPDFPPVKKVNLRVSAGITGFGVEPCTGDDSLIVFRADWYQSRRLKPENLLALKVSGASMEPNLYDGDVVVMNKADTELKDGEVFVFNLDGEVVIKRAVRDGGQWWLDSDNQDKTRFTRKACPEGICIPLGKVIHRQTERI